MIFRKFTAWMALVALAAPALAGSNLPLVTQSGQTRQLPSGTTLAVQPSTTGAASINVPSGVTPTSPVNGDCWTTASGYFCQINGVTINLTAAQLANPNGTLGIANGGTGATTAANARANLGLGTAATQNTGTSGANVPLLNGANAWSAAQDFSAADAVTGSVSRAGSLQWLMATFQATTSNMWLAASSDLKNWQTIGANQVYDDPGGFAIGVHDPSIYRHSDGNYYVVYTTGTGNSFGLAVSSDLVNWSLVQRVSTAAISGVQHTWAPEWFVDSDGSVHVFISANTVAATNAGFQIYEMHPTVAGNFAGSWSSPVLVTGTSLPSNIIDPFVVKIGSTYNMWYTNGSAGLSGGTIELMTSTSLTSGYTVTKSGNWSGWGTSNIDGQTIVQTGATNWTLCFEDSNYAGQLKCATSNDDFGTFSAATAVTAPINIFHGTIIPIRSAQMENSVLNAAFTLSNRGATQGDLINAGFVGEEKESSLVCPSTGLTTGTATNVGSITLTPGDWEVTGTLGVNLANTTVSNYLVAGISGTSATLPALGNRIDDPVSVTSTGGTNARVYGIPPQRIYNTSTTTVYGVVLNNFTTSTAGACGIIKARRMR